MDSKLSKKKKTILKAVKEDTLKCVEELINSNGLERDETYFDYFLLKAALKRKHKAIVNFLLNDDCRVRNANEINCNTPLHYAVELGDPSIVRKLLKKGALISDKNKDAKTPLDLALQKDSNEIINAMLSLFDFENVGPINEQNLALFDLACYQGVVKTIKKFLKCGFPVNRHADSSTFHWLNGNTPLHFAVINYRMFWCASNESNLIIYLLKNGADYTLTNNEKQTPVHLAYYLYFHSADKLSKTIFNHLSLKDLYINSADDNGLTHFHICCAKNIREVIEKFIENGEDINCAVSLDSDKNSGYTPLHFAVENCQENIVYILLNHGADVNLKCKNGSTPLHLACELGKTEITRLLLNFGAGLTSQDNKGCIPLHCAFYKAPMDDLVSLLLERTPKDVNHTDSDGLSIFHIACTRNNTKFVEHFLEQGVSPNLCTVSNNYKYPDYTPMHFAAEYNRKAIVQLLFKYGADLNKSENCKENDKKITPLHMSCMHSYAKFYELCKAKDIDWTFHHENHIDIVKLILKHKADVNAKDSLGKTPLVYLCELSESPLINYCSSNKIDMERKVLKEVQKRIIDIAHMLLSYNADLNACTDSGESILHVITKQGYELSEEIAVELAKLFLKNKANLQIADEDKVTPLHIAVEKKRRNLVDIFLNYNADINAKTVKLMTPLHIAAVSYYNACYYPGQAREEKSPPKNPIVELLLKNGCNLDNQNLEGDTALHMAISKLNYPIVNQLLHYGADINCEDAHGHPPALKVGNVVGITSNTNLKIFKLLDDHIKKLEMIGIHKHDKSKNHLLHLRRRYFYSYKSHEDISFACETELEKMKKRKVDQYTNLYNVLFKDDVEMSRLVKNKSLKNILTDDQLEENFPLYGDILKLQFRRGTGKIALLDKAKESLGYVTGFLLPDSCSERIFRYVSNNDLSTLIKVKSEVSHKRKINYDPDEADKSLVKHIRLEE